MKPIKLFAAAAVAMSLAFSLAGCGGGGDDGSTTPVIAVDTAGITSFDTAVLSATLATYTLSPLSADEAASLTYMRQEEQLAHDV